MKATSSHPKLWSHAVRQGNNLQVLLLNTQARPVTVDLDAAGWQVQQARYFDAAIVEDEAPFGSLPAGRRLTLPARSMVQLQLIPAP